MAKPSPLRVAVCRGLIAGLGAEDIAVKSGFAVADIRGVIGDLRKCGALFSLIRQSREGMRREAIKIQKQAR